MWTKTFWLQVAERMLVGAAIGGGAVLVVGMSAWEISTWRTVGDGVILGALASLFASVAGRFAGNPDSPLATAPKPARALAGTRPDDAPDA